MTTTAFLTALATGRGSDSQPWIPHESGISSKLLSLFRDSGGWVSLLRLEPGVCVPKYRTRGEIHSYILSGRKRNETDGRVLGSGEYDFDPPGNINSWTVEGDEPLVILLIALGLIEYLDHDGRVVRQETTESKAEEYYKYCANRGIQPLNLYR